MAFDKDGKYYYDGIPFDEHQKLAKEYADMVTKEYRKNGWYDNARLLYSPLLLLLLFLCFVYVLAKQMALF